MRQLYPPANKAVSTFRLVCQLVTISEILSADMCDSHYVGLT